MNINKVIQATCTGDPVIASVVESCERLTVKKPYIPIGFPKGTVITAVGDKPTPAEIQAALLDRKAWFLRLAECDKPVGTLLEFAGEVTESLKREVYGENTRVTGKVKNLSDNLMYMLKNHNKNHQIQQVIFVTENGYLIGDKYGYEASFYSSEPYNLNGIMVVDVSYDMKVDFDKFIPYGTANTDYLLLTNNPNIGVFTLTNVVGTSGNAIELTSYNNVLLDYNTYPTVYFEMESLTELRAYASSALRTAGLTYLYKVDPSVDGTVINGNTVGVTVSGTLDIKNIAMVAADTFNVTYSSN